MMKPEQERVHNVLLDTITLLCKNSLPFDYDLRIEGVIGITADGSDIFLVHLNETFYSDKASTVLQCVKPETCNESSPLVDDLLTSSCKTRRKKVHLLGQSDPSAGQQPSFVVEDDATATAFGCGRPVVKGLPKNTDSYGVPVVQGIRSTKTTYGSQGSTAISSTVVTESFVMDAGDTLDCNSAYAVDDRLISDQQQQYQVGHEMEQAVWNDEYESYDMHQQTFRMPQKATTGARRKQLAHRAVGGRGRGNGRGEMSRQLPGARARREHQHPRGESTYVITESTHLCGYPECGKRFRFKHDLLRHQTKVHGREPVRRNTPNKSFNSIQATDEGLSDTECYSEAFDRYGEFGIS